MKIGEKKNVLNVLLSPIYLVSFSSHIGGYREGVVARAAAGLAV